MARTPISNWQRCALLVLCSQRSGAVTFRRSTTAIRHPTTVALAVHVQAFLISGMVSVQRSLISAATSFSIRCYRAITLSPVRAATIRIMALRMAEAVPAASMAQCSNARRRAFGILASSTPCFGMAVKQRSKPNSWVRCTHPMKWVPHLKNYWPTFRVMTPT